jgi:hypothetical protein
LQATEHEIQLSPSISIEAKPVSKVSRYESLLSNNSGDFSVTAFHATEGFAYFDNFNYFIGCFGCSLLLHLLRTFNRGRFGIAIY